jgi:DNA polymerase-3 subunit gamma/tau
MVGQEHVVRALVNALDNERLHHAYLFTGTRGVGKTTVARIFAKALNCERGVSSTPCGECSSCRELDEGRFVDLIEVDAASRTKVEDTRDLLEYVQYAPTRGRYKVYLIDEVHMLSKHSFNALLKTLEEPPPHIKFLLATTDPQRLPVTILSRCLQFNLRHLPEDVIARHLARVLEQEAIEAEAPALAHIASAADGSVRDALSLLDQAIAYGGGRVAEAEVSAMLGTIDRAHVYDLLDALAAGDGAALLDGVRRAAEYTVEFDALLAELISALQRIAVAQLVPQAAKTQESDAARIAVLASTLAREDVQLYYQIALIGRRDLPYSPDARTGVEMVLLRMLAFRPLNPALQNTPPGARPAGDSAPSSPSTTARSTAATKSAAPASSPSAPAPVSSSPAPSRAAPAQERRMSPSSQHSLAQPASSASAPVVPSPATSATAPSPAPVAANEWEALLAGIDVQGLGRELAVNCILLERNERRLRLQLDRTHAHLHSRATEERLQHAVRAYLGADIMLEVVVGEVAFGATPATRRVQQDEERRQSAIAALEADDEVQALKDMFDARIIAETAHPIE